MFWYKVDRKGVFLNKKKYFPKVILLVLSGHVSKLQGLVLTFCSKAFQTESPFPAHLFSQVTVLRPGELPFVFNKKVLLIPFIPRMKRIR